MESFFNDEIVLFLEFIMIVFFTYTPIHCVGYYFQYKAQNVEKINVVFWIQQIQIYNTNGK